jgi:hypothetical protein
MILPKETEYRFSTFAVTALKFRSREQNRHLVLKLHDHAKKNRIFEEHCIHTTIIYAYLGIQHAICRHTACIHALGRASMLSYQGSEFKLSKLGSMRSQFLL